MRYRPKRGEALHGKRLALVVSGGNFTVAQLVECLRACGRLS